MRLNLAVMAREVLGALATPLLKAIDWPAKEVLVMVAAIVLPLLNTVRCKNVAINKAPLPRLWKQTWRYNAWWWGLWCGSQASQKSREPFLLFGVARACVWPFRSGNTLNGIGFAGGYGHIPPRNLGVFVSGLSQIVPPACS
jgi:hypothetical protein